MEDLGFDDDVLSEDAASMSLVHPCTSVQSGHQSNHENIDVLPREIKERMKDEE